MEENEKIQITKEIKFKNNKSIKILVELENIEQKQYRGIKDFLETMFKEIKGSF